MVQSVIIKIETIEEQNPNCSLYHCWLQYPIIANTNSKQKYPIVQKFPGGHKNIPFARTFQAVVIDMFRWWW